MNYITINKPLTTDFTNFHLIACNDPLFVIKPLSALKHSPTGNIADRVIKIKTFSHQITYPVKLFFCFSRSHKPGNISKPQ